MRPTRIVRVWGQATGPATGLSPQARIGVGALLLATILVVDPACWPGLALWVVVLGGWLLAVRPPTSLRGRLLVFGLLLLGPWFLLVPWIDPPAGVSLPVPGIEGAWVVPWRIFFRGLGGVLVCAWTAATLTLPDLASGLAALPVPRALSVLLLQIMHRTHTLVEETRGMAQAIRVRGAVSGLRAASAIAAALPRVWMPRIIDRAERVSDAMEVRGFGVDGVGLDAAAWRPVDGLGLALASAGLVMAVVLWGVLR